MGASPEGGAGLRRAIADYVQALHETYLRVARDHHADDAGLPLAAAPFTVAVVAADRLHLIATRQRLPREQPHEQIVDARYGLLHWRVRFLDSSVLAGLGDIGDGDAAGAQVLKKLGVTQPLYHLVVELQAALTSHNALHAGTALANAHLSGEGSGSR